MSVASFHPSRFAAKATALPARVFWAFALLHLVLWTLIPTLSSPNVPLDVIEGYAWGREWLLGTYKHPPMQSWWLQILAILTGRAAWAHFFASQFAIFITFIAVWRTGRRLMDETSALVGVLLLEGIIYYTFTSTEFNPNVIQLPFWGLIGLFFHRAIKENRFFDWILLGIWSAGGMYSKYSTGLLLLSLTFLMFIHPEARRRFRSLGPYLSLTVLGLLLIPHILWLSHHHFLPFDYAMGRLHEDPKPHMLPGFILTPLLVTFGQFVALIPAILLFIIFYDRQESASPNPVTSFDRAFLSTITFGPFALILAMGVLFGFHIRDMWGMPFWSFIGLWAIAYLRPSFSHSNLTRFAYAWSVISVATLLICMSVNILWPYLGTRTMRIHFPGQALADYVTDAWHRRYHTPLRFAVGDTWPAGNVGYYSPERPHVFINGDFEISPWIKHYDFQRYGGVIVWCVRHCIGQQAAEEDVPDFVHEKFPHAEIQEPFLLARQTEADVPPVRMGWAFIPPDNMVNNAH